MEKQREAPRLTLGRVRRLLSYDPATGVFIWIARSNPQSRNHLHSQAGYLRKSGYRLIVIDAVGYLAHRLAWLVMTGEWPTNEIDHKNGVKSDNKWGNLRDVTHRENTENRRSAERGNVVGLLGVDIKQGKFRAQIVCAGKKIHLGYFTQREDAHQAYIVAKRQFHEGNTL